MIFYRFLSLFLLAVIHCASCFSKKIHNFIRERENVFPRFLPAEESRPRIWFHVSSVGELEQARPVIEHLREDSKIRIILTYYSNSVKRLVKDWSFVDAADFLPLDDHEQMDELVSLVRPRLFVLNRYDLWPNLLSVIKKRKVPIILINASTPPLGILGRIGLYLRKFVFRMVDTWTFVDPVAASSWEPFMSASARGIVTGNPRVDRALERVQHLLEKQQFKELLHSWRGRSPDCLVCGSTWEDDDRIIFEAWKKQKCSGSLVIVPHEPYPETIERIKKMAHRIEQPSLLFSELEKGKGNLGAKLLIVDQRGLLAEIYALGDIAYVGGGYRKQIHSIIEPIAHHLPVVFGPNYRRSPEAVTLKLTGSAMSLPKNVSSAADKLASWIYEWRNNEKERNRALESLRVFLQMHRGAGARVAEVIKSQYR